MWGSEAGEQGEVVKRKLLVFGYGVIVLIAAFFFFLIPNCGDDIEEVVGDMIWNSNGGSWPACISDDFKWGGSGSDNGDKNILASA